MIRKQIPKITTYQITEAKKNEMIIELAELRAGRPHAVSELKRARELGDLRENGFYKAAKSNLIQIDNKIERTQFILEHAQIIVPTKSSTIQIGSTVTVVNDKSSFTYQLVGKLEANPSEGKISVDSPLGKSLIGKKQKDQVTVVERVYKVMSVT